MSQNHHYLYPYAAQNYVAGRAPSFQRPFNYRQPSDTIHLQPLHSLTTDFTGSLQQNNTTYTPNDQYNHRYSSYQTQTSSVGSIRTPPTPGLQLTSRGPPRHSVFNKDGRPSKVPSPRVDWFRKMLVRWFVEWWMLEIMSWGFSAMCMVAIIGILVIYDGQMIPNWPLGLTINGFISVFSNFAKAALLLPTAEALGQLKWSKFCHLYHESIN
jgi:hypothetical protein